MRVFLAFVLCTVWPMVLFSQEKNQQLFYELDQVIDNKKHFESLKKKEIETASQKFAAIRNDNHTERFNLLRELHQYYFTFDYDSAMYIAFEMQKIANQLNDPALISEAKFKISMNLLASGIFGEAKDTLSGIHPGNLNDSLRTEYYYTSARIYFDMADNYKKPFYTDMFNNTGLQYLDSAISMVNLNEIAFYSLKGLKCVREHDITNAASNYAYLFRNFKVDGRQFAIDASTYGFVLEQLGFLDEAIAWYIRAAIQDIKLANKENVALLNLANKLFELGDIERSSKYLNVAFEDAKRFGALQRKFQILEIQPIVEAARLSTVERQKTRIKHYATAVTILSTMVLTVLFLLLIQLRNVKAARNVIDKSNNELKKINSKLREVNLIKETYIGFFFKTNSDLIDKLDSFRQSIDNKIAVNKMNELGSLITVKNIRKEREALYSAFDAAFLNIFPDFVQKFNELFEPEHRLIFDNSKHLNTDLRIFALIRLGILDTEKIAHILNYSVNTINTYKTRIKNLSLIPNEEFEKEILKIQSI